MDKLVCNIGGELFSPLEFDLAISYIATKVQLPNKNRTGDKASYEFNIDPSIKNPTFYLQGDPGFRMGSTSNPTNLRYLPSVNFYMEDLGSSKWRVTLVANYIASNMSTVDIPDPIMRDSMQLLVVGYRGA